jgi:hypothetical protein
MISSHSCGETLMYTCPFCYLHQMDCGIWTEGVPKTPRYIQLWTHIKRMHDILLSDGMYKINIEVEASIRDAERPDAHAIKIGYSSVSFYQGRFGSSVKGPLFAWNLQLDCSVRGGNNTHRAGYTTGNRHISIHYCLLQYTVSTHTYVVTLIVVCVQDFRKK